MKGKSKPYEETHKEINGEVYKLCSDCNEWHPMNEEWFYKNKAAPDSFNPYCKDAAKNRARKRQLEKHEEYLVYMSNYNKNYYQIPENNKKQKKKANKMREEGKQKEWRQSNPDRVKEYNLKRTMNKKHDITDQEWFDCLDFFNSTCAYCGISEQKQYELYGEQFHKEHVFHNGSNYIDNCVPSCTSCNTSKHYSEFKDWYNSSNPNFTEERLNKIIKWMTVECFNTLNLI